MVRKFVRHVAANVVAYLALFVAMSGTATAATVMWTGANIADGTLTGADVQDGSLSGGDIQNGSITSSDLAPGATSGGGTGGGSALSRLDDAGPYDFAAFSNDAGRVPVVEQTFTTDVAQFVTAMGAASMTLDPGAACDYGAYSKGPFSDLTPAIDGRPLGGAGNWDSGAKSFDPTLALSSPMYLPAGTHTLQLLIRRDSCTGTTLPGSFHVSGIHLLATTFG